MLYHLDEHIDHAIAGGLRLRGIDVTTATDVGLIGAEDSDHLNFALRTCRVIVTHDADFLQLHTSGQPHAGIVFAVSSSRSIGEILRHLCLIHDCLKPEEIAGRVEYL